MSARDDLDRLLDFYDKHKPQMRGSEVQIWASPSTIEKFATKAGDEFWYRGYRIKSVKRECRPFYLEDRRDDRA